MQSERRRWRRKRGKLKSFRGLVLPFREVLASEQGGRAQLTVLLSLVAVVGWQCVSMLTSINATNQCAPRV